MESHVITNNLRMGVLVFQNRDSDKLRTAFLSVDSQYLGQVEVRPQDLPSPITALYR